MLGKLSRINRLILVVNCLYDKNKNCQKNKKIFKKMLTIVGIWYNMQTYDRDSDISIQLHRKRIRPLGRRILFKKGFGKEAVDEC